MAIKEIIKVPSPILKKVSQPVEEVNDEIRSILDDMLETMYDAPGIGLAAIQIGIPLRMLVIDISTMDKEIEILYSGGIDSVAIMYALVEVCPKDQLRIIMGDETPVEIYPD